MSNNDKLNVINTIRYCKCGGVFTIKIAYDYQKLWRAKIQCPLCKKTYSAKCVKNIYLAIRYASQFLQNYKPIGNHNNLEVTGESN